jgi:hypothetical protein
MESQKISSSDVFERYVPRIAREALGNQVFSLIVEKEAA